MLKYVSFEKIITRRKTIRERHRQETLMQFDTKLFFGISHHKNTERHI